MTRLGVEAAVVEGEVVAGDVSIDDGRISEVGLSPAGAAGLASAGFVDLQVNWFDGVDFLDSEIDGFVRAGSALASTGVTSYQPTLITSELASYERTLEVISHLPEAPGGVRVLGVHLEGPFISPKWPGAHNPDNIRPPDIQLAERLCDIGPVTYMTLAPEVQGADDLIDLLTDRGIVVSLGHCDADATTARRAYDHGAKAITHIYNAQRRWAPRDPGIAGVALVRSDVTVQAIVDFVHVSREAIHAAWLTARGRFAMVTDAMMAAGLPEGEYRLGDRDVRVSEGAARLYDGTLAGSVVTMDSMVRNLSSLGISIVDVLATVTTAPSRLIGRPELGDVRPGTPADIVVLDDGLRVMRTLVGGVEVFAA
jgi:N-acetylglucosamine-6-phosphate deacetylase